MLVGGGKGDGQSFGHREPVFAEIDGQRIPIVDFASRDSRPADKPISEFRIIKIRRLEEGMLVQAEEKQKLKIYAGRMAKAVGIFSGKCLTFVEPSLCDDAWQPHAIGQFVARSG